MIQEQGDRNTNQKLRSKIFKRTGPLDAYIYQHRSHEENVKETQDDVMVQVQHVELDLQEVSKEKIHIFTDGACTNNGKRGANAAWGLIVVVEKGSGISSDYSVLYTDSGPIPKSETQTNQRAELQGLLKGLREAKKHSGRVTIWSDSQYAINCASVWGPKWKANGWKKQGGPIQHFDLIRDLVLETIEMGQNLSYRWLKAHTEDSRRGQFPWVFNHQVDAIATAALA